MGFFYSHDRNSRFLTFLNIIQDVNFFGYILKNIDKLPKNRDHELLMLHKCNIKTKILIVFSKYILILVDCAIRGSNTFYALPEIGIGLNRVVHRTDRSRFLLNQILLGQI